MHPFFKLRQTDGGILLDTEEPQRKRRRTLSPENQPALLSNWKIQLQVAADGAFQPAVRSESHIIDADATDRPDQERVNGVIAEIESLIETPEPVTEVSILPTDANAKAPLTTTSPKRMRRVRPWEKLASPEASAREPVELPKGALTSIIPGQKQDSTAPKKILKVHSDGKLTSPKADTAEGVAKRNGRTRAPNVDAKVKPRRIVVMKYGADEDAQKAVGQKVSDILLGADKEPGPRSIKPSEPPKATHPFFTSKLSRMTDRRSEQPSIVEGHDSQTSQARKNGGPRELRITSKPTGGVDTSSSASGPICPTFGTDYAKVTRFPGARDPLWPPCEMLHVGRASSEMIDREKLSTRTRMPIGGRNLKDVQIQILSEEHIFNGLTDLVRLYESNDKVRDAMSRDARKFRRPRRKIMTGQALQQVICARLASNFPSALASGNREHDELRSTQFFENPSHKAILHVYDGILQSRTAFDLFRCETQEWVHKYSPKSAEDVLQHGREAIVLRDWLKGSTISSLEHGSGQSRIRDSSTVGRRSGAKAGRKIKRKARELDDFLVPSDEEGDEMDEIRDLEDSLQSLHERKSVMRVDALRDGERNANAVVISGPHGCGKTAAVFAVAKELDFEIFEVNAGSRRSGRDILDRVGDMTRNHLVQHRQDEKALHSIEQILEPEQASKRLLADLESGQQGIMESFLQAKPVSTANELQEKNNASSRLVGFKGKKSKPKKDVLQENMSKPRDQKQSLILLEEVDILFEEDKLFWATVIDLIIRSKRPVVMTCSDESLLPLDEMALFAILRFVPPPELLATDYLLLVAASEGHLLSREALQRLYVAKRFDLRASLAELNLYCQMGIGDSKGGLEWMLIDEPTVDLQAENPSFRVISEDTYCSGMGWLGGEDLSGQSCRTLDEVTDLCGRVWNGWGIDIGATDVFGRPAKTQTFPISREEAWHSLQQFDKSCEAFSAADTLPASIVRHEDSTDLDLQQPDFRDKSRYNYIEGQTLIQADPLVDYTGMSEAVAPALRASAIIAGKESNGFTDSIPKAIDVISQVLHYQRSPSQMSKLELSSTLQPMANYSTVMFGVLKGPSISIFESPISLITTDVAPFVRAIVSYDLRLEEQRRQLNFLLTQPGAESNKTRTTRASRAALEGGSKASTRRERWFPKDTDFDAVLGTGGKEWQDIALHAQLEQSEN